MGIPRTALNTLWLTGGGVLATWLAVASGRPPSSAQIAPQLASSKLTQDVALDELIALETQLSAHSGNTSLRVSARNPFRFGQSAPPPAPPRPAVVSPYAGSAAPHVSVSVIGLGESQTPDGRQRAAYIVADGQLYLATEGSPIAGRYRVLTIDADMVVLRDDKGVDLRLPFK